MKRVGAHVDGSIMMSPAFIVEEARTSPGAPFASGRQTLSVMGASGEMVVPEKKKTSTLSTVAAASGFL